MLTDYVDPEERLVACPNQDVVYGPGCSRSTSRRWWSRCRISATASGSTRWSTCGPTVSCSSARCTARRPASTCWSAPTGTARCQRASPRCSAPRPTPASSRRACSRTTRRKTRRRSRASLRQVMMYPLAEYDGTMKSMDWSKMRKVAGRGERRGRDEVGLAGKVLRPACRPCLPTRRRCRARRRATRR